MLKMQFILIGIIFIAIKQSAAIYCYKCTSATPGCGEEFNWQGIGYLGEKCIDDNDICVKVTEKRGARIQITRDCLSSLKSFRTDMPADKYEGCRPAAHDPHLGNYVNHTIREHDIKRNFYPDVTYCFCFLDHRCNSAETVFKFKNYGLILIFSISFLIWKKLF